MLTVKIKKKSTVLVCSKVGAKKVWQIRVGVTPGVTPGGTTATTLPAGGDGRFCSDRCRMGDLGRWFRGDYAIGRPIEEDDLHGDAWQPGGPGGRDR